jgi:hypothetical protein
MGVRPTTNIRKMKGKEGKEGTNYDAGCTNVKKAKFVLR